MSGAPSPECPSDLALQNAQLGLLTPAEAAIVEPHLLECPSCLQRIKSLETGNGEGDSARPTPSPAEIVAGGGQLLGELMQRLYGWQSAGARQTDPPNVLDTASIGGSRFRVLRPHAKGGLGEVFVAEDLELRREVALKEIQARFAHHPDSRNRFIGEAEITGRLEHPGIVPVYGLGQHADGRPFYAMRFIRGTSLREAIAKYHSAGDRERSLELRKLLTRFVAVCETMEYAHSRGVLHRDLKPANIMLGRYGETLIVDWGLAKAQGASEATELDPAAPGPLPRAPIGSDPSALGSAIGTPAYMSPEQAAGKISELSPATDVYSLGATLYQLLTGSAPFAGSPENILQQVQRGEFRPPRQVERSIARPLEAICLKAMELAPADRYSSAQALADDLEHWLADEPIAALRENSRDRAARWLRKNRALALSLVGALALVAVVSTSLAVVINGQKGVISQQRTAAVTLAASERRARTDADREKRTAQDLARKEAAARTKSDEQTRAAQAARDRESAVAHAVRSSLIQREWTSGELYMFEQYLQQQEPQPGDPVDRRGWEWGYHKRLGQGDLRRIGPSQSVWNLAVSPDGKLLAAAGFDGSVTIYSAASGDVVKNLQPSKHSAFAVRFSPDGQTLAVGGGDMTFETKENYVQLYRTADWEPLGKYQGHREVVMCLDFHPDGQTIATGSRDKSVRLWDKDSLKTAHVIQAIEMPGPASEVAKLQFSPDGTRLATGGTDNYVRLWDTVTGKESQELFGVGGGATALAYDTQGERIAIGGDDRTIRLWDLKSGTMVQTLRGHSDNVTDVTFAESGNLLSCSLDGTIREWDVETGAELRVVRGARAGIRGLAIETNGWRMFTGGDDGIYVWDSKGELDAQVRPALNPGLSSRVLFFPDGKRIVYPHAMGYTIWNLETGDMVGTSQVHLLPIISLALSADATMLATVSFDGAVKVWDVATGQQKHWFRGHTTLEPVSGVAFSPDGKWLATSALDATLRLWSLEDESKHNVLATVSNGYYVSLAFHPEGLLVAGSSEEEIHIWDIQQRKIVEQIPNQITTVHVSFADEGKLLITGGADGQIRIRNWETKELQHSFGVTGFTFSAGVAYASRGPRLIVSSEQMVRIFDLSSGLEVLSLPQTSRIFDVAMSPDGNKLVILLYEQVRVLDASPLTDELRLKREATSLVRHLGLSPLTKAQIEERLRADVPPITPALRERALAEAAQVTDDPQRFNNAAWLIARAAGRTNEEYERAKIYAAEANRLSPDTGIFLNTLGVCEYRLGNFAAAATLLENSKSKNAQWPSLLVVRYEPADVAFLAMARHQLGDAEAARSNLEHARRSLQHPNWKGQQEPREVLKEAEELIGLPQDDMPKSES